MTKFKFVGVHTMHFQLMDEDGNTDGKLYEYTGDHSSFADGIDPEELKEVAGEQKTRNTNGPGLPGPRALASGPGPKLQASSGKLQASSCKLDKIKL